MLLLKCNDALYIEWCCFSLQVIAIATLIRTSQLSQWELGKFLLDDSICCVDDFNWGLCISCQNPNIFHFADAEKIRARIDNYILSIVCLENSIVSGGVPCELNSTVWSFTCSQCYSSLNLTGLLIVLRVKHIDGSICIKCITRLLTVALLERDGLISGILVPSA